MTTVLDVLDRLVRVDVAKESADSIEATKGKIIELQQDQLKYGLTSKGRQIGKYKDPRYARKKNAMNPLPGLGYMDWKLTGELYREIVVKVFQGSYFITSTDDKFKSLVQRFGDPMGLDQISKPEYVEQALRPEFMGRIRKATGL
jgi:hypothetical protein